MIHKIAFVRFFTRGSHVMDAQGYKGLDSADIAHSAGRKSLSD